MIRAFEGSAMTSKYSMIKAALLCVAPVNGAAQTIENRALAILINEAQQAGYVDIGVTERLLGGFVIEAKLEDVVTVFSIDAQSQNIAFSQSFRQDSDTGFFGRSTTDTEQVAQNLVARYVARLRDFKIDDVAEDVDLSQFVATNRTAGFQQDRSLSVSDGIVTIRQSETLGALGPDAGAEQQNLSIEQRTTTGGSISANPTVSFSVQETSQVFQIQGLNGFESEVFEAPENFRASVAPELTGLPDFSQTLSEEIRQKVVTGSEDIASRFPSLFDGSAGVDTRIDRHLAAD